jgi:MFS family permease
VIVGVVFTLARFSEAFLILRAQSVGIPIMWVPAVMVVMNVVYSLAAYPVGVLSDRTNRIMPLKVGIVLLLAGDIILAFVPTFQGVAVGVALWGLHMGFTQGLFATLVADASPPELRGTAYGFFNLFTGLAMLAASVLAGALWDLAGPGGTFIAGACFAALAFVGVAVVGARISKGAFE